MLLTFAMEKLTRNVCLLSGPSGGRYPDANALLIRGKEASMLLDAPLCILDPWPLFDLASLDLVVLSHCHEDHIPGLSADPVRELPCWIHRRDAGALSSLDGLLDLFGMPEPLRSEWARVVVDRFHYLPRPDAQCFGHQQRWDLGGVVVTALHTPGHTAGHCAFRVEPDDVVFLADIDLSGFGPYYGDAASRLAQFEETLELIAGWRARWFVTGHHIGAVDQTTFDRRLTNYRRRIEQREQALLRFLEQPRTMDEMINHRFIYRPGDQVKGADWIERRSIEQHLERLIGSGQVSGSAGRWVRNGWDGSVVVEE